MDTSTFCNSTSTSALVKLGLHLLDRCSLYNLTLFDQSRVAFALPVDSVSFLRSSPCIPFENVCCELINPQNSYILSDNGSLQHFKLLGSLIGCRDRRLESIIGIPLSHIFTEYRPIPIASRSIGPSLVFGPR